LALQNQLGDNVKIKLARTIKIISVVLLAISFVAQFTITHFSQFVDAVRQQQDNATGRVYHSNATGATITFHDHSITSKTSNMTGTNKTGVTGFGAENSMRNMTNPMFLMKKNPLANLSNPLANMTNPLSK
jgi:hypothetical protein